MGQFLGVNDEEETGLKTTLGTTAGMGGDGAGTGVHTATSLARDYGKDKAVTQGAGLVKGVITPTTGTPWQGR